ncbi:MAG: CAP domain-containing protein [Thermoleophilia bacterium]
MRKLIATTLIVMLVSLAVAAAAGPAAAFDRQANERTMLGLINLARTSRGLAPVHLQTALDRAALAHSRDMLSRDYFSHSAPGGTTFATRLRKAGYGIAGYRSWAVGEVIGWGQGSAGSPRAVFRSWMRSSAHRAVILDRRWRDVGVGCARGSFRGVSGSVMYTIDLGRRTR